MYAVLMMSIRILKSLVLCHNCVAVCILLVTTLAALHVLLFLLFSTARMYVLVR